jgi:hypothetical protein
MESVRKLQQGWDRTVVVASEETPGSLTWLRFSIHGFSAELLFGLPLARVD